MKASGKKESELKAIGHYQIVKEIGRGGMAVVYLGRQPSLNRVVAIKVLPPEFASDPELVERFWRESQSVASLNHPNIIQIIDRGQEKGQYYFVMEYVDGQSLEQILSKGPLPANQALATAVQMASALEYAHEQGVIHRDLKPSNILISKNIKYAKLADFGIARLIRPGEDSSTLTQAGKSLGSINYMSPEQRAGSTSLDGRTDIYSAGVVLYQMLTGRLPLGSFRLPSHLDRRLPPSLDRIVLKCLAPDPESRYFNASELLKDLEEEKLKILDFRGQAASFFHEIRRLISLAVVKTLVQRRPLYLMGLAVLIAGLGVGIWWLTRGPSRPLEILATGLASSSTPNRVKLQFEAANRLVESGMPDAAIRELEEVIREHPTATYGAEARLKIGRIKETQGKYTDALADYILVQTGYPRSDFAAEAVFSSGVLYAEKIKNPARAIDSFEAAARDYPSSEFAARSLYRMALLHREMGKDILDKLFGGEKKGSQQAAARALERLIAEHPRSDLVEPALIDQAELYQAGALNDPARSNQYYQELLKKNPETSHPVFFQIAKNYESLGDKPRAREYYQRYLEKEPAGKFSSDARRKLKELK